MKNRLCKENFAKKAVIDTLDYIVNNASQEKVLLFLLCHSKIIGITKKNAIKDYYLDQDIDVIGEDINYYYRLIRKYLTILDDTDYIEQPKYILEDAKKYTKTYF